ncbi:hypothetical protein BI308_08920 [Roseofilum reptotaenium AO1-A]|uniref:CHAT domain-containing protein n=1 Tax=Roseofilum reptotaenium AO1-A TaxID=1925591 RepID=A0A1L9QT77_9CYAN|nr:hypothetical protein BI308_08920 [Roseofilum reptotaenium AO1-A]
MARRARQETGWRGEKPGLCLTCRFDAKGIANPVSEAPVRPHDRLETEQPTSIVMDEERLEAYLNLIRELLKCPNGEEGRILQENRELVDAEFLQVCATIGEQMAEEGRENEARFLQELVRVLGQGRNREGATPEDYFQFLLEVLATLDSSGDPNVVYPLLQQNLDRFDLTLAESLRAWVSQTLEYMELEQAQSIAAGLGNFGNLIKDCPLGSRAENIEHAIVAYQLALEIYTPQQFPQEWAGTQNNLGDAYRNRIRGERAENIENAIAAFQLALQVRTREAFPQDWARTQHYLAIAYCERIRGERAENIKNAIAACQLALQVRTREAFPQEWANTQICLGAAYSKRIREEPSENLEQAISLYQEVLQVYDRQVFPERWAMTQNNLAVAYSDRIRGGRAENIEKAIAAYQLVLEVYTQKQFPQEWAGTHHNLGSVYYARILGERVENLELAIGCYREALEVTTRAAFPQKHADTLFTLGLAYRDLGQLADAYSVFTQAIDTVEEIRQGIIVGGDGDKQKLAEEWQSLYRNTIEVCLEREDWTGALEYAERSKARNLVELLAATKLQPENIPEDLWHRYRDLYQQWWKLQQMEDSRSSAAPDSITETPTAKLRTLRQQLDRLIDEEITPHDPKFRYSQQITPITYRDIQGLVNPKTVLVEWYITYKGIHSFIVTHQGTHPQVLTTNPDAPERLDALQEDYLEHYLRRAEDWQTQLPHYLQELSDLLEVPTLLAAIPKSCEQLILVPYRALHLFPLHALPLGDCILSDHFPEGIRYAPSSQILQLSLQDNAPVANSRDNENHEVFFALQNPTADLEYTDLEVEAIQTVFTAPTILKQDKATKTEFDNRQPQLATTNIAHFACHGYFNFNNPRSSGLILAGSQLSDTEDPETAKEGSADLSPAIRSRRGTFDADKCLILPEIFNLRLPQCRLVVLSACETAITDISTTTDEYISILAAFFFAGSRHVLGTLWAVNDISTAVFMVRFYETLFAKPSPPVTLALKQTQDWMREVTVARLQDWARGCSLLSETGKARIVGRFAWGYTADYEPYTHPYHWAAFCVTGQ